MTPRVATMKAFDPDRPSRFSSSLVAGLAMLRCFSPEHPLRGIADIAKELGFDRTTTHRYATTLVALRYLEQNAARKYLLSPRAWDVGLALLDSLAVRRLAREHLRGLRARTGYTVTLGVLDEGQVLCVDRWHGVRQGQYVIDVGLGLGTRGPVHCSAAGKALLARLPVAEQSKLISRLRLERRARNTITRRRDLLAELERIAASGLALEEEELVVGRRALGAAVLDEEGCLAAAVELAVPVQACVDLDELGGWVLVAARDIGASLGVAPAGRAV